MSSASSALIDVLDRIEDYLEQRQDVRDGSDGVQLPNEAMSLLTDLAVARTEWARETFARSESAKPMREWLVIEDSRKNGVFAPDEAKLPSGYIPRDVAERVLGKSMDGTVWFTREESAKLREQPEWKTHLDPFNCPECGAHDFGLNRPACPHCGFTIMQSRVDKQQACCHLGGYCTQEPPCASPEKCVRVTNDQSEVARGLREAMVRLHDEIMQGVPHKANGYKVVNAYQTVLEEVSLLLSSIANVEEMKAFARRIEDQRDAMRVALERLLASGNQDGTEAPEEQLRALADAGNEQAAAVLQARSALAGLFSASSKRDDDTLGMDTRKGGD